MTAETLARLHARAMHTPGSWSTEDFAELLATPGTFLVSIPSSLPKYAGGSARGAAPPSPAATRQAAQNLVGFALGRVILDEAELLTLAVDPDLHRQGLGRTCLSGFETKAIELGATQAFLEVAATNIAAQALYRGQGWSTTGTRSNYYRTAQGRVDAILMAKPLNPT